MAKKQINKRCPLQGECGRKTCEHVNNELNCSYYKNNATGDAVIADQERIREIYEKQRDAELEEKQMSQLPLEEELQADNIITYLSIDVLFPHPDNPRQDLGDLSELTESIKAKGVLQNLTVVPFVSRLNPKFNGKGKYTVIIGHRRLAAAQQAGLTHLPCVITNMSEEDQIATMAVENMQRSPLTAYEQARVFQMMLDFGGTVESVSKKTGFSESTVRRRVKLTALDQSVLQKVSSRQISIGDLDKLDKIEDADVRNKVLAEIGTNNFNMKYKSALDDQKAKKEKDAWRQILSRYKAKEITSSDRYNGDYKSLDSFRYVGEEATEERIKKVLSGEGPFFYCLDYGWLYILIERSKEEKAQKAAEKDASAEKEAARRKRYEELSQAFKQLYELRSTFIKEYSESEAKKHFVDIIAFMTYNCMENYSDFDAEQFSELMEIDVDFEADDFAQECKGLSLTCTKTPYKALLAFAYCYFEDHANKRCFSYYATFEESEDLIELYAFLEKLGYEKADEEAELLSGESQLYAK